MCLKKCSWALLGWMSGVGPMGSEGWGREGFWSWLSGVGAVLIAAGLGAITAAKAPCHHISGPVRGAPKTRGCRSAARIFSRAGG